MVFEMRWLSSLLFNCRCVTDILLALRSVGSSFTYLVHVHRAQGWLPVEWMAKGKNQQLLPALTGGRMLRYQAQLRWALSPPLSSGAFLRISKGWVERMKAVLWYFPLNLKKNYMLLLVPPRWIFLITIFYDLSLRGPTIVLFILFTVSPFPSPRYR